MPIRVELTDHAVRELDEAFQWYLERSVRAAESFVTEVERSFALLAEAPQVWPEFEAGTRRYVLRRFPYSIIYSVRDEHLMVHAFAHQSRRPGYWRNR